MAYTDYLDTVQKLYIAYYQRPADPLGLLNWAAKLDAYNGDVSKIIDDFANSPESKALYGDINENTIGDVIDAIYQAAFNRSAEPAGKELYISKFKSGELTPGNIALTILNGAANEDKVVLNNKLTSAMNFTKAIDPELDGKDLLATYAGNEDAKAGREFLKDVGLSPATLKTVEEAQGYISANIADEGDPIKEIISSSGKTFILTNSYNQQTGGIDNIVGTKFDDTIIGSVNTGNAAASSFNTGDVINGREGVDTLKLTTSGGGTVLPITVNNVEKLQITSTGGETFNASSVSAKDGLTIESYYSTGNLTVNNIQQLADLKMSNTTSSMYVGFAPSVVGGSDDTVTLTVENVGTKNNTPNFMTENIEKIVINSTGSNANYLNQVGSDNNGVLNTLGTSILKELDITGDQKLKINSALGNSVKTVNASANTAGVTVDVSNAIGNQDMTVTGSSGDDVVAVGDTVDKKDKIDLGDGTDTLLITDDTNINSNATIENVEALALKNLDAGANITIDASKVSGIEKVTLKAAVDNDGNVNGGASLINAVLRTITVDNSANNVEVDYVDYTDTNVTDGQFQNITIKPAVANKDFTLTLNNDPKKATGMVTAPTNGIDLDTNGVTINNVKTLTINSIGGNLANDNTDLVDGKQANKVNVTTSTDTIKVTGDTDVEVTTASTSVKTIDAKEFNANVKVTATTAVNKTVTTGSGNDLVDADVTNANDKYQTINTGAGDDWIVFEEYALTKKDKVDGGEGTDTLVISDNDNNTNDGDAAGILNWNNATFTTLDGVSNLEKIALDVSSNDQTLTLGDTAVSKFGNDLTISWYDSTGTARHNVTINASNVSSTTSKITADFSTLNNSKTLNYTAGKNIDIVKGSAAGDIVNVTDSKLGADDSFDGGKGSDTITLTLSGSGDKTEYSVLEADKLANIKNFETLKLNLENSSINKDYAKIILSNDFAVANQNLTNNTLTIDATSINKDYLTIDASDVEDVQLKLQVENKHINATLGSANDELVLNNGGTATSASYSNLDIDFGDGKDKITVEDGTGTTTVDATGSKFSNLEEISLNNDSQTLTLKVDAAAVSGKSLKVTETTTAKSSTIQIEGASSGASANDTIDLTNIDKNSDVDNIVVNGNAGNDSIDASGLNLSNVTFKLNGGAGNDQIKGSDRADTITGGAGDDTITTGGGNDVMRPGAGVDNVNTGDGDDIIVVVGSGGRYASDPATGTGAAQLGLSQNDLNNGNDDASGETYDGGNGNDILEIWGNVDTTNDTVRNLQTIRMHSNLTINAVQLTNLATQSGGTVNVKLLDASSIIKLADFTTMNQTTAQNLFNALSKTNFDFNGYTTAEIRTNAVNFDIDLDGDTDSNDYFSMKSGQLGTTGNDIINASTDTAPKLIWGANGNDNITGGTKSDLLIGGNGNDTINGGSGNDIIMLNSGNDTVIFADGTDDANWTGGADTIADWNSADDTIKIDTSNVGGLGNGDMTVEYYEGAIGSATPGTAYDVMVLTSSGYANVGAAEDAVAGQMTSTTDAIVVFFDTTENIVRAFYDSDISADNNLDNTATMFTVMNITQLSDVAGAFESADFVLY